MNSGEPQTLAAFIDEVSERVGDRDVEVLSVTNTGLKPPSEVFGKQVHSESIRSYKVVKPGHLAYNPTRINVGSVALSDRENEGAVSPLYVVVRCRAELKPEYLLLFLRSDAGRREIARHAVPGVRPQLRFDDLARVELEVPSAETQELRLSLARQGQLLRERSLASTAILEDLPRSLFASVFNVPAAAEWPDVSLADVCSRVTVGFVGSMSSEYQDEGVPFLRGQNVKRGSLSLEGVQRIGTDFHHRLAKSRLRPGDVVSIRTGRPGITSVIPPELADANCADLLVMTPGPQVDPYFLSELLNQRLGDLTSIRGSVGAAQQHFNVTEAKRLRFSLPPLPLQQRFAEQAKVANRLHAGRRKSDEAIEDVQRSISKTFFAVGRRS